MKGQLLLSLVTALLGTTSATVEPSGFDVVAELESRGVTLDHDHGLDEMRARSGQSSTLACSNACDTLSKIFGDSVASSGDIAYIEWENTFWSQQQGQVYPFCIFQPQNAFEVSTALLILRREQCPFAIRSGGHAAFAGASNIDGGVTFDMRALNSTLLSLDRKIAHVGTGAIWSSVYAALEPENLAVVGGRVSDIGVGGLTLGGGISFFSGEYGWACDNVENYEVVLADGKIVNANRYLFPDLYWALRGGGNNFGIVTRFDLKTFEQGQMWGGSRFYSMQSNQSIMNAFTNFGMNAPDDPKAALILSVGAVQGLTFANADIEYADPVADPPIFDDFKAIPALMDSMDMRSLTNITEKFKSSNPNGLRETYWTATYKLNETFASFMAETFLEEIVAVQDVAGLVPACVMQIITTNTLEHMERNGGNALGLSADDGPLILLNAAFMWEDPEDDEAVMQVNAKFVEKTVAQAKAWGLESDYLYMNYASQFQDVLPSYGHENHKKLREIAKKYDPDQVFQKLQPGYFKLKGGAPESDDELRLSGSRM